MTRRSPTARRLAPVAALLVLSSPALVSCGFDYQTNEINTISHDVNERGGTLDAIGVVLVSAQPGSGTLVTTFVNQSSESAATVESVAGTGEPVVDALDFEPVEVAPLDRATTTDQEGVGIGGITVEGDFVPGDFAPIQYTLGDGTTIDLNVPVVPGCRQWEGVDTSSDADALQPEAADPQLEEAEGTEEPGEQLESDTSAWDCVLPEPVEH